MALNVHAIQEDMLLSLDALVRSVRVKRATQHALFLGAGASASSGVPSAEKCIWEWKRSIFVTNNPGIEDQFSEMSLFSVQSRIQGWLDRQNKYPPAGSAKEYGFYIEKCYPIPEDRRAYFQDRIRSAKPHVGYRLLSHLAQGDLVRSVWTTNFDRLATRNSGDFNHTTIEVGIDCQDRLCRPPSKGELVCVSLHGDYRYDSLKNTPEELQTQETGLREALIDELRNTPLIVIGYSGRDRSVMEAFEAAYTGQGTGTLYWCGYGDGDVPGHIAGLIRRARENGRQAFYVGSQGFDDLMTRLALHCLEGEELQKAKDDLAQMAPRNLLDRQPFRIDGGQINTLIKSNAFEIECPAEVLQFDLKVWPKSRVWSCLREQTHHQRVVAVPLRGKVLAIGLIDDVQKIFGDNIKGAIQRTPVEPGEFRYEEGAIVSLMREALVKAIAETTGVRMEDRNELWLPESVRAIHQGGTKYIAYPSMIVFLRRIGNRQYIVLKPSIKVLDADGNEAPFQIAGPIKLNILGRQHNKPFNQAINEWRKKLFPNREENLFEYPGNYGSTFRFKVLRAPIFAGISRTDGPSVTLTREMQSLLKHKGVELSEPPLLFSNRNASGLITDTHPIRGVVSNRPYDFALTQKGLVSSIRIGVVCPHTETGKLHTYLTQAHECHRPVQSEQDYLIEYPGFQQAYGLPLEIPSPGTAGWIICPEPSETHPERGAVEVAGLINSSIQTLQASYAPHVVLVFFPNRWSPLRGYSNEDERFDVHDFVKAFCVQRGVATQFLNQDTLSDNQRCRVWWWLSLALYVKGMRTPWVLDNLSEDTAFVGLGFSVDRTATPDNHVILGCSHIYSAQGEGLQYRLSKVENPIMHGRNPFMSRDDARRVGETIRELFYEARSKLPGRVVLHKRTPFRKEEREGLLDGLGNVGQIDMLEIQTDNALRYVASQTGGNGKIREDNYPVRRGTTVQLDDYTALLWVHGATTALNRSLRYFQGKRRIPAPLTIRRHVGRTDLKQICEEILGLSKMNWNTFDLYTKAPATLQSSNEIARIGSLLGRFGGTSYDYRLFI